MKNKVLIGLFALFIVSVVAFAGVTYAYKGNANANTQGPNYNEDVHEQLQVALETGDYYLWVQIRKENNLPMNGRIFQVINEENFDKYVELYNAMEIGDLETADSIRAELGLGQGMKKGQSGNNLNGKGFMNKNAGSRNCLSAQVNN